MKYLILSVVAIMMIPMMALAVDPGEFDDFEDGTVELWAQGSATGQPTNVPGGGPGGAGDNYLQTVSTGTSGPGSSMVLFNEFQWSGDYDALGSEVKITMMVANFGATPLNVRIGVGAGGGQFVSTNAFAAPMDGVWRQVTFTLSDAEMTMVGGIDPLSLVLTNVVQFRVLSSASPSWQGDSIAGTLGMDDINITQLPVEVESFSVD